MFIKIIITKKVHKNFWTKKMVHKKVHQKIQKVHKKVHQKKCTICFTFSIAKLLKIVAADCERVSSGGESLGSNILLKILNSLSAIGISFINSISSLKKVTIVVKWRRFFRKFRKILHFADNRAHLLFLWCLRTNFQRYFILAQKNLVRFSIFFLQNRSVKILLIWQRYFVLIDGITRVLIFVFCRYRIPSNRTKFVF